MNNFLTLQQAMEKYDISRSFLYQLRKKKRLQFYYLEKKPFVKVSEFESLMKPEGCFIPPMKVMLASAPQLHSEIDVGAYRKLDWDQEIITDEK